MRHRALVVVALLAIAAPAVNAQEADWEIPAEFDAFTVGDQYVIDSPTAIMLRHGEYRISGRVMDQGSVLARAEVGIRDRASIGVAWGMLNLLGRGEVETYPNTGLMARLLLVEEFELPAIAIGFDNQGYGGWYEEWNRYERKSKGFYLSVTKHWYGPARADVATTGGMNYSLEDQDESGVDFFFGLEANFGSHFGLLLDYNLALNDRERESPTERLGSGKGYLDLGLQWTVTPSVLFKFFLRDLLGNYRDPATGDKSTVERQFLIAYHGDF
jgi:hypothetical protein